MRGLVEQIAEAIGKDLPHGVARVGEAATAAALERRMELGAGAAGASGGSGDDAGWRLSASTGSGALTPKKFVAMPAVTPVTNAATGRRTVMIGSISA